MGWLLLKRVVFTICLITGAAHAALNKSLQLLASYDTEIVSHWPDRKVDSPYVKHLCEQGLDLVGGRNPDHPIDTKRIATRQERDVIYSFLIRSAITGQPWIVSMPVFHQGVPDKDRAIIKMHCMVADLILDAANLCHNQQLQGKSWDIDSFKSLFFPSTKSIIDVLNAGTKSFEELYNGVIAGCKDSLVQRIKEPDLRQALTPLIHSEMVDEHVKALSRALSTTIPGGGQNALITLLRNEFNIHQRGVFDACDLIKSFRDLSAQEASHVIHLAKTESISKAGGGQAIMSESDVSVITCRIEKLAIFKATPFPQAVDIIRTVREIFSSQALEYGVSTYHQLLLPIAPETLREIIKTYRRKPLVLGASSWHESLEDIAWRSAFKIFQNARPEQIETIWNIVYDSLVDAHTEWYAVESFMSFFLKNPLDQIPGIMSLARSCCPFSGPFTGEDLYAIKECLEEIARIAPERRENIRIAYQEIREDIRKSLSWYEIANLFVVLDSFKNQEVLSEVIDKSNRNRNVYDASSYIDILSHFSRNLIRETKLKKYYAQYDRTPCHLNRETLKQAQRPTLPPLEPKEGQDILADFERLISSLNLKDSGASNYLPLSLIDASSRDDNEIGVTRAFSRARGFIKELFGLPLESGEEKGWQTYEEVKPGLKRAIQAIFTRLLEESDDSVRANNMGVFLHGLLYCPTGQKEAIDTVVNALFSGRYAGTSTSLEETVRQLVANFKERTLDVIITDPTDPQNVHARSYYKQILGPELGIPTELARFRERLFNRDRDQYLGDPFQVLRRFFLSVKPENLALELLFHVQNQDDLSRDTEMSLLEEEMAVTQKQLAPAPQGLTDPADSVKQAEMALDVLQQRLKDLDEPSTSAEVITDLKEQIKDKETRIEMLKWQARRAPAHSSNPPLSPEEKTTLAESLSTLNTRYHELKVEKEKVEAFERPISVGSIIPYVFDHHRLSDKSDDERQEIFATYFTLDHDRMPSLLTLEGAFNILKDLGYITVLL